MSKQDRHRLFFMKFCYVACVLAFSFWWGGCATTGDLQKLRDKHKWLRGRVDTVKTKQIRLLADITKIQVKLRKVNNIFNQFRKKGQYNFANMGVKLDELRRHHQELLGNFQVLKLAFKKLQDEHQKLLLSYSQRFGNPTQSSTSGNQVTIQVVSPEALYDSAKKLYATSKYKEARELLKSMVTRYPTHKLTDNAYIAIGQCYEKMGNVYEAIIWYNDVRKKFATGDQADHALLRLGMAHYKIGECPEGRAFLRRLMRSFKNSPYATKAQSLSRNMRKYCRKR